VVLILVVVLVDYTRVEIKQMLGLVGEHSVERWLAISPLPGLIRRLVLASVLGPHSLDNISEVSLYEGPELADGVLLHDGIPGASLQHVVSLKELLPEERVLRQHLHALVGEQGHQVFGLLLEVVYGVGQSHVFDVLFLKLMRLLHLLDFTLERLDVFRVVLDLRGLCLELMLGLLADVRRLPLQRWPHLPEAETPRCEARRLQHLLLLLFLRHPVLDCVQEIPVPAAGILAPLVVLGDYDGVGVLIVLGVDVPPEVDPTGLRVERAGRRGVLIRRVGIARVRAVLLEVRIDFPLSVWVSELVVLSVQSVLSIPGLLLEPTIVSVAVQDPVLLSESLFGLNLGPPSLSSLVEIRLDRCYVAIYVISKCQVSHSLLVCGGAEHDSSEILEGLLVSSFGIFNQFCLSNTLVS